MTHAADTDTDTAVDETPDAEPWVEIRPERGKAAETMRALFAAGATRDKRRTSQAPLTFYVPKSIADAYAAAQAPAEDDTAAAPEATATASDQAAAGDPAAAAPAAAAPEAAAPAPSKAAPAKAAPAKAAGAAS
jgi:hypothetical protein